MQPQTLSLTVEELTVILAALDAVSPSGGGSRQYTVYRSILEETGTPEGITFSGGTYIDHLAELAGQFQRAAAEEFTQIFYGSLEKENAMRTK